MLRTWRGRRHAAPATVKFTTEPNRGWVVIEEYGFPPPPSPRDRSIFLQRFSTAERATRKARQLTRGEIKKRMDRGKDG